MANQSNANQTKTEEQAQRRQSLASPCREKGSAGEQSAMMSIESQQVDGVLPQDQRSGSAEG